MYHHLPSGRASRSIDSKGVIIKKSLMNHFQTRPFIIHTNKVTYPCKICVISCPTEHAASMLLQNFALNSFFTSIYIHIISTLKISVGSQWLHLRRLFWSEQPRFSSIYQVSLATWIHFSPKDFWSCYTIKLQVHFCIKDKSFLFTFLFLFFFFFDGKLVNQLGCSGAQVHSRCILPITKVWYYQGCR